VDFIGMGREIPGSTGVTVTMTNPVSYVGFIWGTPDDSNKVDVHDGSTLLGSFFGTFNIGQPISLHTISTFMPARVRPSR
jgi:hypothetical protein